MKNKVVDKQVIKAISIGISALMSLAPTVDVFAEELDTSTGDETPTEESYSNENEASGENSDVGETISEASDAVEEAMDTLDTAAETEESAAEVPDTPEGIEAENTGVGEEMTNEGTEETVAAEGANNTEDTSNMENTESAENTENTEAAAPSDIIKDDLLTTSDALNQLSDDIADLDESNKATAEANEAYSDMEQAVEADVSFAETLISDAGEAVNKTSEQTETTLNAAASEAEAVNEASKTVYDSEEAAMEAKGNAETAIQEVSQQLTNCEKTAQEAQTKLGTASTALKTAEEAASDAAKKKTDAESAEAEAMEKLEQLLQENGIKYNVTDGNIEIDETSEYDGTIKSAITSMQHALDEAKANSEAAAEKLKAADNEVVSAAQQTVNAARERLEAARNTYEQSKQAVKTDPELDGMLADIKSQQEKIAGTVTAGDSKKFWAANNTLAYNIARYMLSQNENIDRASIGTLWKNGEVDFVKNAIRVSYKEIGSDETKYAYFDYFAYYRDGDAIGTKGHSGMRDYDHIVVLEKQAATYNEDGTAATFVNKGDVMVSELAINNMKDPYQNTFASANAALAELTAAESEMQEIEDTINGYSDAESIADKLDRKKEELKAAQEAFKKDERVEELTLIIKQQQEKLKTLTNTDQFWRERRRLTEYFVEYALRGQGEVTSFEILPVVGKNEAWNRDNGTMNHYVAIKYRMDGEEHLSYFDYIAYYDDGETVSSNNSNTSNFIGKSSMYVKDSSFTPDHIVVVQKNQIEKYNGDIPVLFSDKGTPLISEADFNAGRDHYQSSKSRISSLENDVERLQSALTIADNIKALKDEAEAADTLKGKVSEAKDKVDKAAEALKNARITRAMNSDKLKELTGKLEEARREYESLLEELKIANGRVESIKNIISGIISQTETGYTVSHPEETTHADETSSPKAAEDSKEVIQDQNTADNDKPETPIESVETVEENTADISGEESPAEADAGIIGEEASTEIVGDEAVVDDGDRDEDVDDAYGVSEDSTDADSSVDAPETYETPDITSFDVLGEMRTMEIPGLEPIRAETSSSVFENISSGSQASSAGLASGDLEELDMGVAGERKAPRMAPTQDAQNVRSAVRKKSIVETGLTYSYWLAVLILCLGAAQKIVKKLLTEKPD